MAETVTHAAPRLDIRRSAIEGRGVFATVPLVCGAFIHRMGGRRINLASCALGIAIGRIRFDDPLQIGSWHFIDLDATSVCFNSSCDANAGLRGEVELFALRDIAAGEEITFDYALTVKPAIWNSGWRLPCRCGARTCRGSIGNVNTIPLERLRAYVEAGAGQDYMRATIARRLARPTPGAAGSERS